MKAYRIPVLTVFLSILTATPVFGQICQTAYYSQKLACLPTRTAAYGLTSYEANSPTYAGITGTPYHLTTAVPFAVPLGIGSSYASQIASAPSPAPSAGYVIRVQGGKTTVSTAGGGIALAETPKTYKNTRDFGPLLSDIPETVDRHNLFIGFSFQYMNFTKIGGQPIGALPYSQAFTDNYFLGKGTGNDAWFGVLPATGNASLSIETTTFYVAFGLFRRLDVLAAIPLSATYFGFKTSCASSGSTTFLGTSYCGNYQYTTIAQTDTTRSPTSPWYEYWVYLPENTFANPVAASKLGDVSLSAKWNFWSQNSVRAQDGSVKASQGAALGVEYRMATGDPLNFQGSGAIGIRPSLTYGYNGRWVSPHVNAGFQYNGKAVTDIRDTANFNTSTGNTYANTLTPSKLPNVFIGSAGADFPLGRYFNLDADVMGRKFSNDGSSAFSATIFGSPVTPMLHGTPYKETLVAGVKFAVPGDKLRISAAGYVTVDLNSSTGMSYQPAPAFSFAYEFGSRAQPDAPATP